MNSPRVSIIITTKNSASTLEPLLQSLKDQTYKKTEIILVDNFSKDDTTKIASKYKINIFQKGPERSVQRNYGAKKARGDYLLFLDSDMVLTKNVVKECVEAALKEYNPKLGGLIIPEKSFGEGFWAKAKILERKINEGESFFEAARFFPKKLFVESGGYDISLTGPEDWDLPERISKKYKIGRTKSYILHNEGSLKLSYLLRKKYYYGLSVHKYIKKQNRFIFNQKTVYLLRPSFYKNWRVIFVNPRVYTGMIIMLTLENIAGGVGYLKGIFENEK